MTSTTRPGSDAAPRPGTRTDADASTDPGMGRTRAAGAASDATARSDADGSSGARTGTRTDADTSTDPGIGRTARPDADADSGADEGSIARTDRDTGTGTRTDAGISGSVRTGTGTGTRHPAPAAGTAPPGLREFYENPAVPVASGDARSLRQARMLAAALGPAAARPAVVLDVGCGDGTAAATAAPLLTGHRVIGVDWSQDALRRARTRLGGVVRGELAPGRLPFRSGAADAVLFSEVIEHLVDPDGALDELRRVLRPGGHLMLSTPNLAAWYNRALLLAGVQPVFSEVSLRAVHGRPGREVVGHLRLYTARALREFVAASGFEVVRVAGAPFHGVPRPARPLDRLACAVPSVSSILLLHARKG